MCYNNKRGEIMKDVKQIKARDYRRMASDIMRPIKGSFAVTYLVLGIIIIALTLITALIGKISNGASIAMSIIELLLILFLGGAFKFSLIEMHKNAHKNKTHAEVGDLFIGFKRYGKSVGLNIMTTIFTLLWSLLLIVPGIIKLFSYAMTFYISLDNPNKPVLDCITESRHMMKGHKWRLFCLTISYIGWGILCILTLGILALWVAPKFNQAYYEFYLKIKETKK